MSEIERAIIDIRNAQKKDRRITLADGTQLSKEWVSIDTLELVEKLLRAKLSRRETAPMTCDGCKRDVPKGEMKYSRCLYCIRQKRPWIFDRYEPKGANP